MQFFQDQIRGTTPQTLVRHTTRDISPAAQQQHHCEQGERERRKGSKKRQDEQATANRDLAWTRCRGLTGLLGAREGTAGEVRPGRA